MMKEDDRQRVFWLLKKYSSYTAWKALGDAFQSFTDGWEYALRHAKPEDQDEFAIGALKNFWQGCEAFDKGLALLKQGDRYIFRNKGNWLIRHEIEYARRLMDPVEYVHEWMVNKEEIYQAQQKIQEYKKFLWICEKTEPHLPATFKTGTVFLTDTWPRRLDYSQFNFPQILPEVPPASTTTVNTGSEVPADGIWEPEWIAPDARKQKIISTPSLFSPSIPGTEQKGCMNYLVGGTLAPLYKDGMDSPVMPVRWRLIWEDRRYRDGVIPPEEAEYLASAPQPEKEPSSTIGAHGIAGGQPCPETGYYFTPARPGSRRKFNQGEVMPELDSAYGATVWQWDQNQTPS